MKEFTGGVIKAGKHIKINLSISGGVSQTRTYDSDVQLSIDKLSIVNNALSKIPLECLEDVKFYINELTSLFKSTNIDLVPIIGSYQLRYNIGILTVYIKSCINSFAVDEAIQLLNCNRMQTELNSDCDNKLLWTQQAVLSRQFIDEITETDDEDIVVTARQLRNLVNQYVDIIQSKKDKIDKAYQNIILNINKQLSS